MKEKLHNLTQSEGFTGGLLIVATLISLTIANSHLGEGYEHLLSQTMILGHFNIHMIVNDFLMAIFFLCVGLEIKQEVLYGNLSSFKKASFPIIAAMGGVLLPAIIFFIFNAKTGFSNGMGVPISTDIAFAIGIFMILKNKFNPKLKIFLLSLAVVDDLISILVIGIFYSSHVNIVFLGISALLVSILLIMNRKKVDNTILYIGVGLILWFFIYSSGVHATISGVLVAMAIPSTKINNSKDSMLERLEHKLSPLCNLCILPLFALVNTAINLNLSTDFTSAKTLIAGIVIGLVVGKPLGIMLFTWIATKLNITEKPEGVDWLSVFSVSLLAGIGFTMSIFVAEIAFEYSAEFVNISKISILLASVISIFITYTSVSIIHGRKHKSSHIDEVNIYKKGMLYEVEISKPNHIS